MFATAPLTEYLQDKEGFKRDSSMIKSKLSLANKYLSLLKEGISQQNEYTDCKELKSIMGKNYKLFGGKT
jgi:hypothetical protein